MSNIFCKNFTKSALGSPLSAPRAGGRLVGWLVCWFVCLLIYLFIMPLLLESCTHTDPIPGTPWWKVDLESIHLILSVTLYNRDFCENRLHNFDIRIGDHEEISQNELCFFQQAPLNRSERREFPCHRPLLGR